ncbi:MAG: FAD-dependent oxidoreductase [Proteobacteria bacterium]|nr:FAD-dependent oxidoreductase [Pseudomonadota bacterium]
MSRETFDIGVLGGGSAGLTVAAGSARFGARVLLVEKEPVLGGDCLHYGCVPSKTLIETSRAYHQMKNASRWGLDQPPLASVDFSRVAARIAGVIAQIQTHDSPERFCSLGVDVRFGDARFADEQTIELSGERLSAKKWVIATGSSPVAPPIPGLAETPHLTNRDLFSLPRLPGSLLILGGGPIGIEMAQAFSRLGSTVTVIEMGNQILAQEDPDMAGALQGFLEQEGVRFLLSHKAVQVQNLGDRRKIVLQGPGGEKRAVEGEQILVAVGRRANVTDLGLDSLGIEATGRGLAVDSRMRTNLKHIFAAGDAKGPPQLTHAAGYEGGIVVANAVLRLPRKADYTWLCWCAYTDPELASVGMNEKRAAAAGLQAKILVEPFSGNDRSLAESNDKGFIKLVLDKSEKPLGVQILGPAAGELIQYWVAALNGGAKLSTLAGAITPYPTLGEINKRVAGRVFEPKIYSPAVKKSLKLFFGLKGRACGGEGE